MLKTKHNIKCIVFVAHSLFFAAFSLAILSCKTTSLPIEGADNRGVVKKIKKQYTRRNLRNCKYKEKVVFEDTVNHRIIAKEINYYNCRGAYTFLVKSKKWVLKNGKLKRTQ